MLTRRVALKIPVLIILAKHLHDVNINYAAVQMSKPEIDDEQSLYEIVPVDKWTPPVDAWARNYRGSILNEGDSFYAIEKVIRGYRNGVPREYITLRNIQDDALYFATVDLESNEVVGRGSLSEIAERMKDREVELYSDVLTAVANNQSPNNAVEEVTGIDNPEVNGRVLQAVLEDTRIIRFTKSGLYTEGEIYPFVPYYLSVARDRIEISIGMNLEAVALYAAMEQLGLDVWLPYGDKSLGLFVGEEIAKNPDSTKLNVKVTYDGTNFVVEGDVNRSLLVRTSDNIYYSTRDERRALEIQRRIAGSSNGVAEVRYFELETAHKEMQGDVGRALQSLQNQLMGPETPQQRREREKLYRQIEDVNRELGKGIQDIQRQLPAIPTETPYQKYQREQEERRFREDVGRGLNDLGRQLEQLGKGLGDLLKAK